MRTQSASRAHNPIVGAKSWVRSLTLVSGEPVRGQAVHGRQVGGRRGALPHARERPVSRAVVVAPGHRRGAACADGCAGHLTAAAFPAHSLGLPLQKDFCGQALIDSKAH